MNDFGRRKFVKIAGAAGVGLLSGNAKVFSTLNSNRGLPGGAWAVMVTPITTDLQIDYPALKKLIKWYERAGIHGFFANCASSEMYDLTPEERLELTRFVVKHSKVPVVSTGTFSEKVEENAAFIRKIYETGVNGVVIITSVIVRKDASESEFAKTLFEIVDRTSDMPLGIYECSSPYKRLVSPVLLNKIAETGRFVYLKDTSCDAHIVREKIEACKGTRLGLYNAHTPDVLDTMQHKGAGTSTIASNFYPELYAYICKYANNGDYREQVNVVNNFILENEKVIGNKYRISAKYFMKIRGLPININSRNFKRELNAEDKNQLQKLWTELRNLAEELEIKLA